MASKGVEIERRFFPASGVKRESLGKPFLTFFIKQYYLCSDLNTTVRLRISTRDRKTFVNTLTLKGRKIGASCPEVELEVPSSEVENLLMLAQTSLTKVREVFHIGGYNFEWDIFNFGVDQGSDPLQIIEVEFSSPEEAARFDPASWLFLGKEVTEDRSLSNKNLALPYNHLWLSSTTKE